MAGVYEANDLFNYRYNDNILFVNIIMITNDNILFFNIIMLGLQMITFCLLTLSCWDYRAEKNCLPQLI